MRSKINYMTSLISLSAVLVILGLVWTSNVSAQTRQVAVGGVDTGPCIINACATINYAISQAVDGNTINVDAGIYTEANIAINKNVTIAGADAATTIVQAHASATLASSRVMRVAVGANATLTDLTVRHGHADANGRGGGIRNNGVLALINATIQSNLAFLKGGGVYNTGTLTIDNSTLSENFVLDQDSAGGGVYNTGVLTILNSTISDNGALNVVGGNGGGVYNTGTLTIDNTTISHNDATTLGGGIWSDNTMTLTNSTLNDNGAEFGGGICNRSENMTIDNSLVRHNFATDGGGGIYNVGVMAIHNSTVRHNDAGDDGGGIRNANGAALTITNSTINRNKANANGDGGGIYNPSSSTLTIANSTLSNNSSGFGGGIYNNGTVTADNLTLRGNVAHGDGGGVYNDNSASDLTIRNSIITASSGGDCFNHASNSSAVITGLNNLVDDDTNCPAIDRIGAVSNLDAILSNNGGPTKTYALLSGSNAIDAGGNGCSDSQGLPLLTDQRGEPRPLDGDGDGVSTCDIGAYEK